MDIYGIGTPKVGRAWYWRGLFCVFAQALFLLCLAAAPAQAADYWWIGSVSQDMNDADNWATSAGGVPPAGPPQDTDTIHFEDAPGAINNDLAGLNNLSVVVGNPGGAINIGGNAFWLTGVDMSGAQNDLTFTSAVNVVGTCDLNVASGRTLNMGLVNLNGNTLRTNGAVVINNVSGAGTIVVQSGQTTLTGGIAGNPDLQVANGAVLDISGGTMAAGAVTINTGGQLAMNGNSGTATSLTGSGEVNLGGGGGTLTLDGNTDYTWSGNISGNGSVDLDGIGSRYITGTNNMVGPFNAHQGEVNLTGSFPNANMTFSSGTTFSGTGSVGGSVTCVDVNIYVGGDLTAGAIRAGTWNLNGGSTFHWDNLGGGNYDQLIATTGDININNANFALGNINGVYIGDLLDALTSWSGNVQNTFNNLGQGDEISQGSYTFKADYTVGNLLKMLATAGQSSGGGGNPTPPTPTPDPGNGTQPPSSPPQMTGPNGQPMPNGSSLSYSVSTTGTTFCWDPVADAAWYNIYRRDTPNGDRTFLGGTKSTCYTDTSGQPGTQYYYSTEACNDNGCSSSSGYVVGKKAEVNKGFVIDINQDGTEDMVFWDPDKKSLVVRYEDGHTVHFNMSPDTDFNPDTCMSMSFSYDDGAPCMIYTDHTGAVGKLFIVGGEVEGTLYHSQAQESGELVEKPLGKLASTNVSVHLGDFNGDGYGDLLLREMLSGKLSIWLLNDEGVLAKLDLTLGDEVYSGMADPDSLPKCRDTLNWEVICVCDFNADGKSDILWLEPVQGQVFIWFMDSNMVTGCASLGGLDYNQWMFRGTADFNGDGWADMLWRNRENGALQIWFLDGTQVLYKQDVEPRYGLDWRLKGTGDFNGDGKADIYWRHFGDWEVRFWFMDGANWIGTQSLGSKDYFQPYQ
jgi:hypothetical protein